VEREFSELDVPFAAVATDSIPVRKSGCARARYRPRSAASIAVPGLFQQVAHEVAISSTEASSIRFRSRCAGAMGADIVLAVDLGSDLSGAMRVMTIGAHTDHTARFMSRFLPRYNRDNRASEPQAEPESMPPSLLETLMGSINIMQLRIARSRLAGERPTRCSRRGSSSRSARLTTAPTSPSRRARNRRAMLPPSAAHSRLRRIRS